MKSKSKLQQKILVTLAILTFARLGIFIPIPGINHNLLESSLNQNGLVNFLNIFSGGGFSTIGIFALGIVPYINSSIIMQIALKIIPELENLQKEGGELGRQKINQITRYLTLVWGIIQSAGIALWIKPYVFDWDYYFIIDCIIALTTGSIIIMWFSEVITEYGIGNGPSLLIFQNIVSSIPKNLQNYKTNIAWSDEVANIILFFIIFIVVLATTVLIQEGKRKIIIVSAKQLSKVNKFNSKSYMPLKLNQGGVMPIVFASAAMTLPIYLSKSTDKMIMSKLLNLFLPNGQLYLPAYCFLIITFSYFYSSIILNPSEIAENLKKMGASIPSIRPGLDTTDYLRQVLNKLTFAGGLFLFSIVLVPSVISKITKINTPQGLGITSLLILVGVSVDTAKQIQTYIISQQYDTIIE